MSGTTGGRSYRGLALVAASVIAAASVVFTAAPANAATASGRSNHSCGPNINVFNTTKDFVKTSTTLEDGASVNLSEGLSSTYGWTVWAHLAHGSSTDLGSDWVWMDWSDTPGSWHQCGPFEIDGSQGWNDRWTWGVNTVTNRYFRACGMRGNPGTVHCTGWRHG